MQAFPNPPDSDSDTAKCESPVDVTRVHVSFDHHRNRRKIRSQAADYEVWACSSSSHADASRPSSQGLEPPAHLLLIVFDATLRENVSTGGELESLTGSLTLIKDVIGRTVRTPRGGSFVDRCNCTRSR